MSVTPFCFLLYWYLTYIFIKYNSQCLPCFIMIYLFFIKEEYYFYNCWGISFFQRRNFLYIFERMNTLLLKYISKLRIYFILKLQVRKLLKNENWNFSCNKLFLILLIYLKWKELSLFLIRVVNIKTACSFILRMLSYNFKCKFINHCN